MEIVILVIVSVVVLVGAGAFFVARGRGAGRAESLEGPGVISRSTTRPAGTDTLERDALVEPGDVTAPEALDGIAPAEDVAEPVTPPTFRSRLGRARSTLAGALGAIRGRSGIDADTWDELEEALLLADVGVGPTQRLLDTVRARVASEGLTTADELIEALKGEMKALLAAPVSLTMAERPPTVWLFVGVNGVGKTTTIGKVGHRLTEEGRTVVMAAGDTFRAAAAEQLSTWADRCGADFVRGAEGGDPSSVIFDGIAHGAATGADVVLCDTAGRLHTKSNLMDELAKVRRVADKGDGTVTEVLLVLDATTGQNGLTQARQFTEATSLTGVVLTKLDGSAKGGIVLSIASELGIPVKLVGLGEQAADLVDFDAEEFVEALFAVEPG